MKTPLNWLQFLRPSVQRDLVALVHGCHAHPAYRAIRRSSTRYPDPFRVGLEPASEVRCPVCAELYVAKQRVGRLLK
jgi:hypothetical protein